MSLPQAAADHYRQQQRLTTAVVANARRVWGRMDERDFDRAWMPVRGRLTALMVAGQVAAASASERYVNEVVDELGIDADPVAAVNARAFGASASDGRPLSSLLDGAIVSAKQQGSLDAGQAWLDMAVQTQMADASRGATGTAIAARPTVTGYTRMLNPPSCSRCAILAGRFYRWNAGFDRHPRCDCRHIPATEDVAGDLTTDSRVYFDSLDSAEQERIFTKSGARAIRDGADINQVVNARRGMYRAADGSRRTRSGTARGTARGQARPMPEHIYQAATSRAEAIQMLRRAGYLT